MRLSRKTEPRIWQITYLLNWAMFRALRRVVDRLFRPDTTARILDVGCGTMPYRGLFEGRCKEYIGCDYYPAETGIVQCSADSLTFQDETFDAIVSFQVLEHVRKPWAVVAECARVLKHEGLLLLTAPFVFPHHSSPNDFFRFTHEGLAAMAEEAGLRVEHMEAQCGSVPTLLMLCNWYLMRPINVFNRRIWTRPLAWLLTACVIVPINALGWLLDQLPIQRPFQKGNEGFSNYLIVCRKA